MVVEERVKRFAVHNENERHPVWQAHVLDASGGSDPGEVVLPEWKRRRLTLAREARNTPDRGESQFRYEDPRATRYGVFRPEIHVLTEEEREMRKRLCLDDEESGIVTP